MIRLFPIVFLLIPLHIFAQQKQYIVKRGDTFTSIASKYGIKVEELKSANIESDACYIGRKLIIPQKGIQQERFKDNNESVNFHLTSNADSVLTKSTATTYQVGEALWKKGKYEMAIVYLLHAADEGEQKAYYPLAECFSNKNSERYDEKRAAYFYHMACDSMKENQKYTDNYLSACLVMAQRFLEGNGVPKNLILTKSYMENYSKYAIDVSPKYLKLKKSISDTEKRMAAIEQEKRETERKKVLKLEAEKSKQQRLFAKTHSLTPQKQISKTSAPSTKTITNKTPSVQQSSTRKPFTIKDGLGETTYYPQSDGSMKSYTKSPCVYCWGKKTCSACMYASMVQSVVNYHFICPMCGGTRICLKCNGKGYSEYWGYTDRNGTGAMIGSDGRITTAVNGHTYSNNSNKSSSSNRKTNIKSVDIIKYAPDYTGGKYTYWCDQCKKWGSQHIHQQIK